MVAELPPHLLPGQSTVVGDGVQHLSVARANLSQELLPICPQLFGASVYAPVLADYHVEEFH